MKRPRRNYDDLERENTTFPPSGNENYAKTIPVHIWQQTLTNANGVISQFKDLPWLIWHIFKFNETN